MKIESFFLATVYVAGDAKGSISVHEHIESRELKLCVADALGLGLSEILVAELVGDTVSVRLAETLEDLLQSAPFISVSSDRARSLLIAAFGQPQEASNADFGRLQKRNEFFQFTTDAVHVVVCSNVNTSP
jgi:hypothetical protein